MDRAVLIVAAGLCLLSLMGGCTVAPRDERAWLGARDCRDPDWAFLCERKAMRWGAL